MAKKTYAQHFNDEGKQLIRLPKKWLDLSRFKVGDQIRYLDSNIVHIPCAECLEKSWYHHGGNAGECGRKDMKGEIGTVLRVNQGDGQCFPSKYIPDSDDPDGGIWLTQRQGWLTVKFPFSNHRNGKGEMQPLALHPDDEGKSWELVTAAKPG